MSKNFLSINSNFNDFSTIQSNDINKFVLENQESALSKVYGFCQKQENILLVNGFLGTGKTQIIKHLLCFMDKTVESFIINCSPSITLDDFMLTLWEQFISNPTNAEIAYRYRHTKSFQERIIGCFSETKSNIIISILELDLTIEDNIQEILDFIWTITQNEKIKIIISSKTFDTTVIPKEITYTKVILKAFSRIIFEKFLQEKGIKGTTRIIDELYKITRGYYFYTEITSQILNIKNLSISNFLVAYTNSGMSFDNFLAKAFISMLPENEFKILSLLAIARHPLNAQMIDYINIFDQTAITNLEQKNFIKIFNNMFIINNYFRNAMLMELSNDEKEKLHKILIKYYNDQLPLKPSERLIMLSRKTMRQEIIYHNSIINPQIETHNTNETNENIENISTEKLQEIANNLFVDYNYQESLKFYIELLNRDDSDKISIQSKLAEVYEKLGNFKYALHYLNNLIIFYTKQNDNNQILKTKLCIAKIYYQTYKTEEAINILNELITESSNNEITIECYTILGNIYISLSEKNKAYELYNKAILIAETLNDKTNLPELYFKFAIIADENNNLDTAVNFYNKCIEVSENNNKYKSLSYSNLGDFYLDLNNKSKAKLYFQKAYETDIHNNNDYGIYYSATNLAKLNINSDQEDVLKYLKIAKTSAIKINDIFAMANSGLHLGDFYFNNNKIPEALNEYFSVLNLVKDKFNEENKKKILIRINDIKQKIGEEKFNELHSNFYK